MEKSREAFYFLEMGKLNESLEIYKELQKEYGDNIYSANVSILEKRLNLAEFEVRNVFKENGVDCVYIINLEKRFDRKLKILREMSLLGSFDATLIKGVDAKESVDAKRRFDKFKSIESHKGVYTSHIKDEKLKRIKDTIHLGAFGYNLSQKKIFKHAKLKGYKKIAVFDDDVFFTNDFIVRLKETIDILNNDYKIIMLGASEYMYQDEKDFYLEVKDKKLYHPIPGRTLGSFGALYDRSIYDDVLGGIDSNLGTFDNVVLGHIFSKYNQDCYVVNPNICVPSIEESDIRNDNREQYTHANKMHWNIDNFSKWSKKPHFTLIVSSRSQIDEIEKLDLKLKAYDLNVFYFSKDGLRSLQVNRSNRSKDLIDKDIVSPFSQKDTLKYSVEREFPESDFYLFLKKEFTFSEINIDTILEACYRPINGRYPHEYENVLIFTSFEKKVKKNEASIIIPLFREIDKAWQSIESALSQSYPSKVIVVNDNPDTEDETSLFINKKIKESIFKNQLKLIQHGIKRGAAAARNTGLWSSDSEFICFLDDDDIYLKDRVKDSVLCLQQKNNEKVAAAYCGFTGGAHNKNNKLIEDERFLSGSLFKEILGLKYNKHYVNTDTVTYRREALVHIGGFNESYVRHQDVELNSRFFVNYTAVPVKKINVIVRPSPQEKTFIPSFDVIYKLKTKLINDFSPELRELKKYEVDEIIKNHAKDIMKHYSGEQKVLEVYNKILKQLMDLI